VRLVWVLLPFDRSRQGMGRRPASAAASFRFKEISELQTAR